MEFVSNDQLTREVNIHFQDRKKPRFMYRYFTVCFYFCFMSQYQEKKQCLKSEGRNPRELEDKYAFRYTADRNEV